MREWLKSLSHEEKKLIGEDIKTVQFSWPLGMPLVRKYGFIKKTQKTPKDDLDLAIRRMKQIKEGGDI